ncbi:CDP-alcohol phosphatidyltransferase family protein [Falsiroseomonas sp.]|uniref:CDP-alcohol phosphatidyltransferase family protein n=1 Tax=Falsiroseomonas sp. TaxID=2870721 RepID=UPI002724A49E|nr:CDP-alcohol phosphatidyltransferase family protein [Falsiroseomonas sp.]MDO9501124.1 CDP-alcohol phosphatidyltransferase family protein [Falsiroseomonas sp.]
MAESGDRRPIAARELGITRKLAGWLVARGASADAISLAGMVAGLLAGLALALVPEWHDGRWLLWLLAALLIQLRLLANMLDGMVAVGRGIASPAGELFNEVPDRVSDTAALVGLGIAAGAPVLGWAAALAAMATAYVRTVGRAAGAPSDFRGPMAKPHRMALVTVVALWCGLAPASWAAGVPVVALWIILALSLLTAWRRLHGAYRFLRPRA